MSASDNSTSCSPYDDPSYAVVAAVSAGLAFLSTLLITGVIGIIILFKKWRFFSQRLILYVALAAILLNVGIILHRVDYNNQNSDFYVRFCRFGGFLDQCSNWILLISISAIITHSSFIIFLDKNTEKYEMVYIAAIFGFPLLVSWIPFVQNSYGRAGAWCWIRSEDRGTCRPFLLGTWLQFTTWFVPLYAIMVVLVALYAVILVKMYRRRKTQTPDAAKKKDLLPLIAYPLIYFLLNIFPFINRIYNLVNKGEPNIVLWYFAALANPSVGAWIALAFTLDPGTRKRLTRATLLAALKEICGKNKPVKEYQIEDEESSVQTESYHGKEPPYKSFEDCYKLNLDYVRSL